MEETLKKKKPNIDEQIKFIHGARIVLAIPTAQVVHSIENTDMLMAIEENLITIRLLAAAQQLPNSVMELVSSLLEAKTLIKQWHGMGQTGSLAERAWKTYDAMSPEMGRINAVIKKYQDNAGKEVSNG